MAERRGVGLEEMRRGVGLEVIGVPDIIPADRTVDKLLIHFLRPRNGGGEVRRVLYPTHLPGQALVIYEDPDVASRVLQKRNHELQIGDLTFPLEVKPADRPEVDLPVEAILNVSMVADKTELRRLLDLHGFEIIEGDRYTPQVKVKGSMMRLRSFKAATEKLLSAQTPNPTRTSSPASTSSGQSSPSPPGVVSKNSTHGSSARAKQKPAHAPPAYAGVSLPPTYTSFSPSSLSPVGPVDGPIGARSSPSFESFVAPADAVLYARRCELLGVDDLLGRHGAEMKVVATDTEVSTVTVTGRDASGAAVVLRALLHDISTELRTREVPLDGLDRDAKLGVAERLRELAPGFPMVVVRETHGALRMIGPRSPCERLKEKLLQQRPEEEAEAAGGAGGGVRTGRSQEKRPMRRSRSVPRTSGRGELPGEFTANPVQPLSLGGGGGGYSSTPSAADRGRQGAALGTPEVIVQRGRSGSLTRTRAKPEENAHHGITKGPDLKPTGPVFKAPLMLKRPKKQGFLT